MRIFFGSDFIGNQKIFSISVEAENVTHSGDSQIVVGASASLTFEAEAGYVLPSTIEVEGASYVWDDTTGVLALSNPTANVVISITADQEV